MRRRVAVLLTQSELALLIAAVGGGIVAIESEREKSGRRMRPSKTLRELDALQAVLGRASIRLSKKG